MSSKNSLKPISTYELLAMAEMASMQLLNKNDAELFRRYLEAACPQDRDMVKRLQARYLDLDRFTQAWHAPRWLRDRAFSSIEFALQHEDINWPEFRGKANMRKDPVWLRALKIGSFAMPTAIRCRLFTPGYEDLRNEFVAEHTRYVGWERKLLIGCFIFRALLLVLGCVRAMVLEYFLWVLPPRIRAWWTGGDVPTPPTTAARASPRSKPRRK